MLYSKILLSAFALVVGTQAHADPSAIQSVAHIDIMPDDLAKVADAFARYVKAAPKEPGAIEVKMVQQIGAPNHFSLFEVWSDKRAYNDHVSSPSAREFKKAIAPYLGSPYDERLHTDNLVFSH